MKDVCYIDVQMKGFATRSAKQKVFQLYPLLGHAHSCYGLDWETLVKINKHLYNDSWRLVT